MRSFVDADSVAVLESPEEVLSTLTRDGKRKWLYPTLSTGRFWRWRRLVGWLLIALFVALPIVPVGGRPAVLLDVAAREFALFGFVFYPTDTLPLVLAFISAMLFIFLFTALLGRVWCGWACPQTVYLEFVFRPVERLIEGAEHVRRRRDEGPWTFDKAWRKGAKWSLYTAIALGLAHTFVAYFAGWERLLHWMTSPPTQHWGYFVLMAGTTGLVLFDFGVFREQMCTITCPYARFQSVLLDPDSLIVSYDPGRGEPRARRSKKKMEEEEAGLIPAQGDCIDCFACVRTCPTGIDIRDGLQMECIACTQCIDACDDIMDKIGKPRGLIRYTSEHALEGRKTRVLRPRTLVYTAALTGLTALLLFVLAGREAFDVNVGRAVGAPYMELPDGRIANRLRFRVRNQQSEAATFTIEAASPAAAEVRVVGASPLALEAGEMTRAEAWVVVPREALEGGRREASFRLRFSDGTERTVDFTLLGPSG